MMIAMKVKVCETYPICRYSRQKNFTTQQKMTDGASPPLLVIQLHSFISISIYFQWLYMQRTQQFLECKSWQNFIKFWFIRRFLSFGIGERNAV